jgi:putative exporter of polyketide antibiotics
MSIELILILWSIGIFLSGLIFGYLIKSLIGKKENEN